MSTLLEKVREETPESLFSVRSEKMFSASGAEVPGKVCIVNEMTDAVLGVVSPTYRIVTNHEVVSHLSDALDASGLDLDEMVAKVETGYGGSRSQVKVLLPAHTITLPKGCGSISGDETSLEFHAFNSYDGRWKYALRAGAVRFACLNGQVLGSFLGSYVEYHNSKLDVEEGARRVTAIANQFSGFEGWFASMVSRELDQGVITDIFGRFLTGAPVKDPDLEKFMQRKQVSELTKLLDGYRKEMGDNAYALYNALTDYVTHRERRPDTGISSRLYEEDRIARLVDTHPLFAREQAADA